MIFWYRIPNDKGVSQNNQSPAKKELHDVKQPQNVSLLRTAVRTNGGTGMPLELILFVGAAAIIMFFDVYEIVSTLMSSYIARCNSKNRNSPHIDNIMRKKYK